MKITKPLAAAVAVLTALGLAACSQDPGAASSDSASASSKVTLKENSSLHALLPDSVKSSGKLVSVNSGSFPPYTVISSTGSQPTGAASELLKDVGQILGVKVSETTTDGFSGELAGIAAGRYDMSFGPVGDFKERQASADFVDWVQEFVVFAVKKGNPEKISSLGSACGHSVAVMAGGSAEKVIQTQAATCASEGKGELTVQSYKDQPSSVLAVQSGRADAFFSSQAPLTYFVEQSKGALQLAGTGQKNGFDTLYQGAVVPKDSDLGKAVLGAIKELVKNGDYARIMKKYNLEGNMISQPALNKAVS
jgi:polar amino acid transport system substrate-binding protein